ncbi:Circadian clock protein kinase KaiC [Candidatus Tiddalikarchaeum anstoanum]|nr:Circadian clock protein kinase KaiC [Candidatus Tiddalikarchaeum anstoanum]
MPNDNMLVPVGIAGFDDVIGGGVFPGSCILLITPPLIEARLFGLEFIYRGLEKNIPGLFIAMDESPETLKLKALRYGWVLTSGESKNLLKWVDGYSSKANIKVNDTNAIKRVSGPLALSDISIAISGAQALFGTKSSTYKLVFDSLSTLSFYSSPETIYRFLQVITAKVKTSNGVGLFVITEGMHSPDFIMTIRHMMDTIIQFDDNLNFNFQSELTRQTGRLLLGRNGFEVK